MASPTTQTATPRIILGSSSPRRQELLQLLFPQQPIQTIVPEDDREEELVGELSLDQVRQTLIRIATRKGEIVRQQLARSGEDCDILITADTAVVVPVGNQRFIALGKPQPDQFPNEVADWFNRYYSGKSHRVLSAVCVENSEREQVSRVVSTDVSFAILSQEQIDWYLRTKESLGKAGGYAIQGVGSLFVDQVTGSLTNVIGLPLRETRELIQRLRPGLFSKETKQSGQNHLQEN